MDEPKVMLLVPLYRTIPSSSVASLLDVVSEVSNDGLYGGIAMQVDIFISDARNLLAKAAVDAWLRGEATHALWIDQDMTFPRGTLKKLLAHEVPVVSGLYYGRELIPVVFEFDPIIRIPEIPESGLAQVDGTGFGCLLMEIGILHKMAETYGTLAWFQTPHEGNSVIHTGEDVFFFKRLKVMGIPAYLDCDIHLDHIASVAINHDLVTIIRNAEGVIAKEHRR